FIDKFLLDRVNRAVLGNVHIVMYLGIVFPKKARVLVQFGQAITLANVLGPLIGDQEVSVGIETAADKTHEGVVDVSVKVRRIWPDFAERCLPPVDFVSLHVDQKSTGAQVGHRGVHVQRESIARLVWLINSLQGRRDAWLLVCWGVP